MKISDACNHKKSLSFEIFPPKKDSELKNIDATLDVLCELQPDFISVTFGAGGSLNCNRTIELAKKIKQNYHVEPVVHLTCLNYNRAEIDEFARILTEEGIQNVLALRGDRNPDLTEKDDFKHASDLISYLKPKGDFCFLGACYPECHPEAESLQKDIENLKIKVDSGVDFLVTQMFFDNNVMYSFLYRALKAGIDVPVIAGVMPVINAKQIKRSCALSQTSLPPRFRRMMDRFIDDPEALKQAGIAYATEQIIDLISNGVSGIHIYTMNKPEVAGKIMENLSSVLSAR